MENQRSQQQGPRRDLDRRQDVRHPASAIPQLAARLSRGPEVLLIDISRRGALIENDTRLRPGLKVDVCFVTSDAQIVLSGCVVRSSVSDVSDNQLRYRTALSFGEDNTLLSRLIDEHAQSADPNAAPAARQASTGEEMPVTLVMAVKSSAIELRELLTVNDW